ncbi:MAG: helix-turn-helix domain-containing protein [Acidimicrobiales bacterium]
MAIHMQSNGQESSPVDAAAASVAEIEWMSSEAASRRLGVTVRTLYRLINDGQVPAYRFGRVIRLQRHEVDAFIQQARIPVGALDHLYPEPNRPEPAGSDQDMGILAN